MKLIIILVAFLAISIAEESGSGSGEILDFIKDSDVNIEEIVKLFVKKAKESYEKVTESIKEVSDLAKKQVDELVAKAKDDVKEATKEAHDLLKKFNKIKDKSERDLEECSGKFSGEKSSLGQLIALSKDLEEIIEEIQECPVETISGMGCTLGKLLRGEATIEEIDGIMKAETDSAEERAESIIETIQSCNEKAILSTEDAVKEFIEDVKRCSSD